MIMIKLELIIKRLYYLKRVLVIYAFIYYKMELL
jgi:hypothetical protein